MRSVSIRKQITTISTIANPFIFYFCIMYTVFQLFYDKNSSKKIIESSKQAHNTKKTESVKNRTVCSNLDISNTSVTQTILKIRTTWAICILIFCKKNWYFITLLLKIRIIFVERKSFCFSARSNQLSPTMIPKALLGTNTN